MILKLAIEAIVLVASIYLLMVSVCIVARMTPKTSHVVRFTIVVLGGVSFMATLKTLTGQWQFCAVDLSHIVAIFMCAVTIVTGLQPPAIDKPTD